MGPALSPGVLFQQSSEGETPPDPRARGLSILRNRSGGVYLLAGGPFSMDLGLAI
jgi:hypothetical protein